LLLQQVGGHPREKIRLNSSCGCSNPGLSARELSTGHTAGFCLRINHQRGRSRKLAAYWTCPADVSGSRKALRCSWGGVKFFRSTGEGIFVGCTLHRYPELG